MPYKLVEVVFAQAGSLGMVLVAGHAGETIVKDTEGQAQKVTPRIKRGDVITKVDGQDTKNMSHGKVLSLLRSQRVRTRRPLTIVFAREVHGLGASPGSWSTSAVIDVERAATNDTQKKAKPKVKKAASTSRFHFGKNKAPPPPAKKAAGGVGWRRQQAPPPPPPKNRGGIYMGHAYSKSMSSMSAKAPPKPPKKDKSWMFKTNSDKKRGAVSKVAKASNVSSSSSVAARIAAFSGNKTASSPTLRKPKPVAKAKKWPPTNKKNAASFSFGASSSKGGSVDRAKGVVVSESNATAGLRHVKKSAVARVEEQQKNGSAGRSLGSYNTVWRKEKTKIVVKKPPPPVPSRHIFYEALYDFKAEHSDELSFSEGDRIRFLCKVGDGEWLKGYAGGREGIFPASYAQRIQAASTGTGSDSTQRRTSWVASHA